MNSTGIADPPKVSLLLMTYNCAGQIKTTLRSIEGQDYPNMELVISDGGSTDGTLAILEHCAKKSKYTYDIVSEKDRGLYHALNKDISRATGDYLLVMNDQLLYRDSVSSLVEAAQKSRADGAHADLIYASDQEVIRYWKMGEGKLWSGWMPGHPTLLLRREVYERFGDYREDYKSAADYEFMVRILRDGDVKLAYVPRTLVRMYYGGTSTTGLGSYLRSLREGHRALTENGIRLAWVTDLMRTGRVCLQFVQSKAVDEKWRNRWSMSGRV